MISGVVLSKKIRGNMASPQPAKKRITEEEAAERLVAAFERHLSHVKPSERKRKVDKFLRGPKRSKGGTPAR
jgi:hypothetical protein